MTETFSFSNSEYKQYAEECQLRASHYQRKWLCVIDLPLGSKNPGREGWPNERLNEDELRRRFSTPKNIGIILGEPSKGRADVDIDIPGLGSVARLLLPDTGFVFGRATKPWSHWEYDIEGDLPKTLKLADPRDTTKTIVELRTTGQTVYPPSIHQSGEKVQLSKDGEAARVEGQELVRAVKKLAAVYLLSEGWGDGSRHDKALRLAGALVKSGWDEGGILALMQAICTFAGDDDTEDRLRAVSDTVKKYDAGENITGWRALHEYLPEKVLSKLREWLGLYGDALHYRLTDSGNSERFADMYGDIVRYVHPVSEWRIFDGKHWQGDVDGKVHRLALESIRTFQKDILTISDSDKRAQALRHAAASEGYYKLRALVEGAKNLEGIANDGMGWDSDPMRLGVNNGVVDLRTATHMAGEPGQYISLHNSITYDPQAQCPRWLQFLREVLPDDETRDYVSKYIGYSLTGNVEDQSLMLCYGTGANGKTTLLNILRELVGQQAHHASMQALMAAHRNGSSASPEIANMKGKRLVTAVEANEGARLNEALIKQLTGADPITARQLYQGEETFMPKAKYWLGVNHRPDVRDTSRGFWRRVRVVPFTQVFEGKRDDLTLESKLLAELPGILNWAVEQCLKYQREGLTPPKAVIELTEEYRQESDPIAPFVQSELIKDEKAVSSGGDLYKAYTNWADQLGISRQDRLNLRAFGQRMAELFTKLPRTKQGVGYQGVRVLRRATSPFDPFERASA